MSKLDADTRAIARRMGQYLVYADAVEDSDVVLLTDDLRPMDLTVAHAWENPHARMTLNDMYSLYGRPTAQGVARAAGTSSVGYAEWTGGVDSFGRAYAREIVRTVESDEALAGPPGVRRQYAAVVCTDQPVTDYIDDPERRYAFLTLALTDIELSDRTVAELPQVSSTLHYDAAKRTLSAACHFLHGCILQLFQALRVAEHNRTGLGVDVAAAAAEYRMRYPRVLGAYRRLISEGPGSAALSPLVTLERRMFELVDSVRDCGPMADWTGVVPGAMGESWGADAVQRRRERRPPMPGVASEREQQQRQRAQHRRERRPQEQGRRESHQYEERPPEPEWPRRQREQRPPVPDAATERDRQSRPPETRRTPAPAADGDRPHRTAHDLYRQRAIVRATKLMRDNYRRAAASRPDSPEVRRDLERLELEVREAQALLDEMEDRLRRRQERRQEKMPRAHDADDAGEDDRAPTRTAAE